MFHIRCVSRRAGADPTEECEPNDSFEQANTISEVTKSGTIVPALDKDFFLYKVSSADVYRIALSCPIDINVKMTIFSARTSETVRA